VSKEAKRVTEVQRQSMCRTFETIANGDAKLETSLINAYDANHLVVGTRLDNWKALKDSSNSMKSLCDQADVLFDKINTLAVEKGLTFIKKGKDGGEGSPRVSQKVEIIVNS
tara:strand:- start:14775 stop:15110 length:336 start_codon:yes stop_codon:yes gene_type:complete